MISASPRRLTVFKQVVDLGGFNAAASRLGIAQPSVGAHIKALEDRVGQPLFYRHRGARPQLTKAGETLYAFAVEVLRKSEETTDTLADLKASEARQLMIAVHRDLAPNFLSPRLATFARANPKARLVTRIGTIEDVLGMVRTQAATLGLALSVGPIAGLHSEILAHEPLEFVASPGHALARRRTIAPDDLADVSFVTGLRDSRYFQMVDAVLKRAGLPRYDVAMELQESSAVKEVVRHGNDVACLPRCTVTDEIRSGTLAALRLGFALPQLEIRCVYRAPATAMARKFLAHLKG
jgi:LysR family transcriptional regulator, low CO2-responsive transcriptional regulator